MKTAVKRLNIIIFMIALLISSITSVYAKSNAELQKDVDNAKKVLKDKQAIYDRGSLGFFEYMVTNTTGDAKKEAQLAVDIINYRLNTQKSDSYYGWTKLGASTDATNLENFRISISTMIEFNKLTAKETWVYTGKNTDPAFFQNTLNQLKKPDMVNNSMFAHVQVRANAQTSIGLAHHVGSNSKDFNVDNYFKLFYNNNISSTYNESLNSINSFVAWYVEERNIAHARQDCLLEKGIQITDWSTNEEKEKCDIYYKKYGNASKDTTTGHYMTGFMGYSGVGIDIVGYAFSFNTPGTRMAVMANTGTSKDQDDFCKTEFGSHTTGCNVNNVLQQHNYYNPTDYYNKYFMPYYNKVTKELQTAKNNLKKAEDALKGAISATTSSISNAAVSGISNKTYTGKAITQTPKVVVNGITLKNGTDYTLSYKNNINVGTATVTITGKGNYTGTINKNYEIIKNNDEDLAKFISRMYQLCLNREPDANGKAYWVDELKSKRQTAADVVHGFFFGKEMTDLKLNDNDFVERCYKVMMDRGSDKGGKEYWLGRLDNGMSREYVVKNFIDSNEFTNICNKYGITKGTINVSEARDKNYGITSFVARCYTKALGRKYDVNGLNFWCNTLLNSSNVKQAAIDVASNGFFHSQEFKNKNLNNSDYIKVLYRTFLGREAEASGLNYWLKELSSGKSRDDVLKGFANSTEFSNIMAGYGLK